MENNFQVEENSLSQDTYQDDPQPSPEFLQRKLYFLVDQLKQMHSALPE